MSARSQMMVAALLGMAAQVGAFDSLPTPKEPRKADPDKLAKQSAKLARRAARYHKPEQEQPHD